MRGFLSEVYKRNALEAAGFVPDFVQENHLLSQRTGTVRSFHFPDTSLAMDKLVRMVRARIFDVAVDLRRSSPTFGRHIAAELSAENRRPLLIPRALPTACARPSPIPRLSTRPPTMRVIVTGGAGFIGSALIPQDIKP